MANVIVTVLQVLFLTSITLLPILYSLTILVAAGEIQGTLFLFVLLLRTILVGAYINYEIGVGNRSIQQVQADSGSSNKKRLTVI